MVLHSFLAGLDLGSSGGTTWDDVGSTNYACTGDNEVQERGGVLPSLIGLWSWTSEQTQIGATTDYDRLKLQLNTWPAAHYIQWHPHVEFGTAAKHGGKWQDVSWFNPGIPLDRDADWTLQVNSTTASMTVMANMFLSYGQRYPYKGGQIISRMNDFATDGAVWPSWAGGETINDLDPRVTYRLAGVQVGNTEDQPVYGVQITSPSNNTKVQIACPSIADTTFHCYPNIVWLPYDSILVSGVETVTIDATVDAVTKPTVYTFWEVYGGTGSTLPASQTAAGGLQAGGGFGGLSSLFMRPR